MHSRNDRKGILKKIYTDRNIWVEAGIAVSRDIDETDNGFLVHYIRLEILEAAKRLPTLKAKGPYGL